MLRYHIYRDWYLLSKGTIANVELGDLDLNFQTFQMTISTKAWKCKRYYCHQMGSLICHQMAPLRMLYIMTLTYIFKETNFEIWISWKRWKLAKNAQILLLLRQIFAIDIDHCECCTLWPSLNYSRSQILNVYMSEKVRPFTKMYHMTFAEVDIRHRIAPLWMF